MAEVYTYADAGYLLTPRQGPPISLAIITGSLFSTFKEKKHDGQTYQGQLANLNHQDILDRR